jgi:iron complex transport system substrate-binding protein
MSALPKRGAAAPLAGVVVAALLLAGCGRPDTAAPTAPAPPAAAQPAAGAGDAAAAVPPSGLAPIADAAVTGDYEVTDDTGATLRLAGPARRIVSLTPGGTELLFAAGAGELILATSRGSDTPEAAAKIPTIGDSNAVNYERLVELRPDVVVVWEHLNNRLVIESLTQQLKLPTYFIRSRGLADIPQSVRRLGVLAGTEEVAERAARELEARLAKVTGRKIEGEPLRVFYMLWAEPLYTVGSRHIIGDAITRCGGRNIFEDIDFPAPIVEIEAIVKRDPDVMLLSAPPITARDWRERWGQFQTVRAVQTRQLLTFSDPRLDRMGPTAIDAVEGLCVMLDQARAAIRDKMGE